MKRRASLTDPCEGLVPLPLIQPVWGSHPMSLHSAIWPLLVCFREDVSSWIFQIQSHLPPSRQEGYYKIAWTASKLLGDYGNIKTNNQYTLLQKFSVFNMPEWIHEVVTNLDNNIQVTGLLSVGGRGDTKQQNANTWRHFSKSFLLWSAQKFFETKQGGWGSLNLFC